MILFTDAPLTCKGLFSFYYIATFRDLNTTSPINMIFFPSFLTGVLVAIRTSLPCSPAAPRSPRLTVPDSRCSTYFCVTLQNQNQLKQTLPDAASQPLHYLPRHSVMPPPSSALPPHPVSSSLIFPPLPVLPSPHLCVTVVLIWTLVLQLPRIPTNRVTSPTNTHKQKRHTLCTHAWNTPIQYIPQMPVQTHTLGKQV